MELFAQLPWRRQILDGLLGADLVGFQTPDGAANFLAATRRLLDLQPGGDRVDVPHEAGYRAVRVGAFPIWIDAAAFDAMARQPDVQARAREIREEMGGFRLLFLGVDRLDYTKGIDVRLRAFSEALVEGLLDSADVTMLQVAVPSRGEHRRVPADSRRDRAPRRAASTGTWAGSGTPRSTTSTSRCPARSSSRSTSPPT